MRKEEALFQTQKHSWTANICAPINSNTQHFHPFPPLYPFSASPLRLLPLPSSASSPSPPPPPPPPLLCLLPLLSSVSSPCTLRLLPPPFRPPHPPPPPFTSSPSPFLEEKDNQNTKRKNESYEFSIQLRTKIDNWNICHRLLLAVYLKDIFCR